MFSVALLSCGLSESGDNLPNKAEQNQSTTPTVQWGPCSEDIPQHLQCATLPVPRDYRAPLSEKNRLEIALIRWPGLNDCGDATRSLLINPGGPGASGVTFLAERWDKFAALHDTFHLVGFDPRGVGRSNPIICPISEFSNDLENQKINNLSVAIKRFAVPVHKFIWKV